MDCLATITFAWTPLRLGVSVVAVLVTAVLCFLAWRRKGYTLGTAITELMRLAAMVLIAVTLNQPEWVTQERSLEAPTLVVLWDESQSMQTRDVLEDDRGSAPPESRGEWIQPLLQPGFWAPVADKLEVVIEPFSSALDPPQDGTDLGLALQGTLDKYRRLRGIVLLSDGDWNCGESPARAANRLRLKQVPVYAVAVGSDGRLPDIAVQQVDAPTFGVIGKSMRIPYVIESALPRDYPATVTLRPSVGEAIAQQVTVPAMGRLEDAILWFPDQTGNFELSLEIPAHPDELIEENNRRTVPIAIREETLKVLLVESTPRWEYRYLRNALERDPGVQVHCLLLHPGLSKVGGGKGYLKQFPEDMEQLAEYDVVFLGDVGLGDGQLTIEHCRLMKGLVESQASGLVFMPGIRGSHLSLMGTELEALYPVVLDPAQPRGWGSRVPAQMELTEAGRRSLLTKLVDAEEANARLWETLPGFQWYAPVHRAKAGTEVLATHATESGPFGRLPLLVTRTAGTGKVLFMGTDAVWRWREGVEDRYHYRFWGQVFRWMAYQRSMAEGERMRLFYAPDRPLPEDLVTLNANVMSGAGGPLSQGTVVVQIESPSGIAETVRLAPAGGQWGLFTGKFTPRESGTYGITVTCRENGATLETELAVQGVQRERLGEPLRRDVLEEIAAITRGQLTATDDVRALPDQLAALPEPEPSVHRLRLWCHPLWAGFLVLLLGCFWSARKMIGTI